MTLKLDYLQRISLRNVIGSQNATVDDMRAWWGLQDKLILTEKEAEDIGFKMDYLTGAQVWDPLAKVPEAKDMEFTAGQVERLKRMLKECRLQPSNRGWLEPLLNQLFPE